MMALLNPFEKRPATTQLNELQRLVSGERLSVRALGERLACDVAEAKFPVVTLNNTIIEKINATSHDVGRTAVQTPRVELHLNNNQAPTPADKPEAAISNQKPLATVTELTPLVDEGNAASLTDEAEKMRREARATIERLAA